MRESERERESAYLSLHRCLPGGYVLCIYKCPHIAPFLLSSSVFLLPSSSVFCCAAPSSLSFFLSFFLFFFFFFFFSFCPEAFILSMEMLTFPLKELGFQVPARFLPEKREERRREKKREERETRRRDDLVTEIEKEAASKKVRRRRRRERRKERENVEAKTVSSLSISLSFLFSVIHHIFFFFLLEI